MDNSKVICTLDDDVTLEIREVDSLCRGCGTCESVAKDKIISILKAASDQYGSPHLIDLMNQYDVWNLQDLTLKQMQDYAIAHGLGGQIDG